MKKDKLSQLHLDKYGRMQKNEVHASMLNNTFEQWSRLVRICKYDENFKDNWNLRGEGYIDAIYVYEANSDVHNRDTSQPFDIPPPIKK